MVVDQLGHGGLELLAARAPGGGLGAAALQQAAAKVRGQRLGVTFDDPHVRVNPRRRRKRPGSFETGR